ncbi:glycosyltransferase family 2 protein [Aequorivita sp. CIP111184]|uniref:glycosyltransferase family 2 protein n=1 Tax=Aequorivita sp. CIP111184 TaxID=2211356 RepID=UPI000DBBE80E|nr:glycosyltransferase family 2 protein [Aequorivita sp. CIP111184]SRX55333.1 UDP-Glc:alpha-D-GlcNAc-diphosphoundecaprenol beta-1,3-glucosyltransferase WfgD [Aequorivita sp. CIP111184]
MSISIITPHYNDPTGLLKVYKCLLEQTQTSWQWVIVDDLSDTNIRDKVQNWHQGIKDNRVKLICNPKKSNASVSRNLGADTALYENLVFLDADDIITPNFIANRQIEFYDFAVLKNTAVINQNKEVQFSAEIKGNYLNYFLQARFIWPITAIVWKKTYFDSIGQFNPQLPRLQDVELAIRAMQNSENFIVVDNEVDFYYNVKPIRSRKNFLKPVCDATYIFIDELLQTQNLSQYQLSLLSGYYFMCTKYLERSESRKESHLVFRNLRLFYKKGHVGFFQFLIGGISLKLYEWRVLSGNQFLRVNRYVFKPKN